LFGLIKNIIHRLRVSLFKRAYGLQRRLLYRNHFRSHVKRLLIVKLDSIGDYLLFRNFIAELKRSPKYADFEITLCGNMAWKDLAEKLDRDHVRHFIWLDYEKLADSRYNIAAAWQLYRKRFHTAITPTFSRCRFTDEMMLQSGARIKIAQKGDTTNIDPTLKAANDKRYTWLVEIENRRDFEFNRNKSFFSKIIGEDLHIQGPSINNTANRSKRIVICPGARHLRRQWAPSNFYWLSVFISEVFKDAEFHICGSADDAPLAKAIAAAGKDLTFKDHTGALDLAQLMDLISGSALVLCNDSAPYHLASAVNTPVICISNGNHYKRFCPYPGSYMKKNLEIFPPSLSNHKLSEDEIRKLQDNGSDINIQDITVEHVITKIKSTHFLDELDLGNNH
jgi:ADP-heptose:LPS heptosyltransferase